jgi:NADP-dependent 3-hydroxy acid dehydrogenase YdfG
VLRICRVNHKKRVVVSTGSVGIITGASSGIGEGAALEFAKSGCRVVLVGRDSERCARVGSLIVEAGGEAIVRTADIRESASLESVAADVIEAYGRIDFLVANAGVTYQSSVVDGDPEQWRRVVDTNVLGTMLSVRAVLPHMIKQGAGHIFLMSSISGRVAHVGEPAYVASKFAIVGFGHALRMEVEPAHIRVTIVEPGLVNTPILEGNPRVGKIMERVTPLTPADVGRAMVFAFEQPSHVEINEVVMRPMGQ